LRFSSIEAVERSSNELLEKVKEPKSITTNDENDSIPRKASRPDTTKNDTFG
jgi:hypothetical protein